jgi:hypothetical protein
MDKDDQKTNDNRVGSDWNELNELTLSVMSNRTRYDKYKKTVAGTSDTLVELFCKEKIYYKDRVLAMTRGLFDERCENDDINRAHEEYLKSCIEYLKWCDITEMVEQDKRTEVRDDVNQARHDLQKKIQDTSSSPPPPPPSPSPEPSFPPPPSPPSRTNATRSMSDHIMSFANKMCIRKKTMDDFIVMKPIHGNTHEDIKARLPKVRDYHNEIMKRASEAGSMRSSDDDDAY